MTTQADFLKVFDRSFWRALKDSVVPYRPGEQPNDKNKFLQELHGDLASRSYVASSPRDYIIQAKSSFVPRIVPAFSYRDAAVHFFAVKSLEEDIAENRVPGTYGGWRLGNALRNAEESEPVVHGAELDGEYVPTVSFDRYAWREFWQDFQKKAYQASRSGQFSCFLKFDIANFYDSINVRLLEDKLRAAVPRPKRDTVNVLIEFLGGWNRTFEGYARKTVGIPCDELMDCSRLLANFYLQDYDEVLRSVCESHGATYLRYADDQIICSSSEDSARRILLEACKALYQINLSVNAAKVDIFHGQAAFDEYWAFEIFEMLADGTDNSSINTAAETYLGLISANRPFRQDSVLKRLLALGLHRLNSAVRYRILSALHSPQYLARCDFRALTNVYKNSPDKPELFGILDALVPDVHFNAFHFNLLKFYGQVLPKRPTDDILARLDELRISRRAV